VYPRGVSRAQTSLRVKGLAVLLYLLGLSCGAVSLALEALGVYLYKSVVYDDEGQPLQTNCNVAILEG